MGLLDDAIREHLDLKRRRGADPTEVARMEQEALGPVRREPAQPAAETEPTAAQAPEHPQSPPEHPEEHTHVLAPEDRHEPPHGDPLMGGAAAEPEPEASDDDRAGGDEDARPAAEGRTGAREGGIDSTGPARSSADPAAVDQPTTEYRVEEDVLEETPDFLQETPEHDRLWFEQRPPRDFDFDD